MDSTQELTHISLCTGYAGIDLGLGRALGAVRSIAYVEIEAFPIINLVKKIEAGLMDSAPIFTDLKAFPWGLYRHKVDILSGGFPCQPFSAAGRRAGDEDPRHLWPYIVKGIKELGRPPIVFFENVEGIISSKLKGAGWRDREGTPVLLHVLRELERLDYDSTASLFTASECGATHERKRVFILGVRNDLKTSGYRLIKSKIKRWSKTAYPRGKGSRGYLWEPKKVVLGNSNNERLQRQEANEAASTSQRWSEASRCITSTSISPRGISRDIQSSVGGNHDGCSDRLDFAKLSESCDSRVDELRMLGNGVVPETAARAFKVLFDRLSESHVRH